MKKIIYASFIISVCFIIAEALNTDVHSSTSGSPAGYTGSPLEFGGRTCTSCHAGTATPQAGIITHNIPDCGYIPGETYTINVTATFAGRTKFGFQFSAQNSISGNTMGSVITNSTIAVVSNGRYVNHLAASTQGNGSRTWSFQWIAPPAGSGTVNFYTAVNCTNGNNSSSGDVIYTDNASIIEANPLQINSSGSTEICQGESVILQSSIPQGNTWQRNGLPFGMPGASSITVTEAGVYTLTNNNNACTQTQSITISVGNQPLPPAISIIGNTTFCEGENVQLSASGEGIAWFPGNIQENNLVVSSTGTYFATANNACGTSTSENIEITVIEAPSLPVIISSTGLNSFCEGDNLTLSAEGDNLTWNTGESGNTIVVFDEGTYSVTAENICSQTESLPFTVAMVNLPPLPDFEVIGDLIFCEGGSVILQTDGSANITWQPSGQTSNSISIFESGAYSLVASNGCGSTSSDTVTVEVLEAPEVPIIIESLNNLGEIELRIENVVGFFTWFFNENELIGQNENSITVAQNGIYTAIVSNENDCISAVSEAVIVSTVNVIQPLIDDVRIFPNPANEHLFFSISNSESSSLIRLYNMQGQQVLERLIPKGTNWVQIETSQFKGMLIAEIIREHVTLRKRIVVN
jgi:hypothetical protein